MKEPIKFIKRRKNELESLEEDFPLPELFTLPASSGATNIYLVGDTVFIILFRENTIGLQISHPDIAQTLHFIFDQLQKRVN